MTATTRSRAIALQDDNGLGGNDRLFGEAGNDLLRGGSGNDLLDGGDGMDTALFDGNIADYTVTGSPGSSQSIVTEIATGDTDVLFNVESLAFLDTTIPVRQHPVAWRRCLKLVGIAHHVVDTDPAQSPSWLTLGPDAKPYGVGKATFTATHELPR